MMNRALNVVSSMLFVTGCSTAVALQITHLIMESLLTKLAGIAALIIANAVIVAIGSAWVLCETDDHE